MLDAFEAGCAKHGLINPHVERFVAAALAAPVQAVADCTVERARSQRIA